MEKVFVVYKSKYGAAKEYAQLLGKSLNSTPVSIDQAKPQMLNIADTIILCGGIYASSIAGLSFLKKNASLLQGKAGKNKKQRRADGQHFRTCREPLRQRPKLHRDSLHPEPNRVLHDEPPSKRARRFENTSSVEPT